MLIPSIDLKDGQVVQLIQGKRPALATNDVDKWIDRFRNFQRVQLIDLDAAMGNSTNNQLIKYITLQLPCRVGGGIRSVTRAREVIAHGATAVIIGSSLFRNGQLDTDFAEALANAVGTEQIIAAVDSLNGHVVIKGWTEDTGITAVEAVRVLEPFCGEFLYTHVDNEGLMEGTNIEAVMAVRNVTSKRVTAAGGITTQNEIDQLHAADIDAVVGMAIYTGRLDIRP